MAAPVNRCVTEGTLRVVVRRTVGAQHEAAIMRYREHTASCKVCRAWIESLQVAVNVWEYLNDEIKREAVK